VPLGQETGLGPACRAELNCHCLSVLLDRCSPDEHIAVVAVFEQVDHFAQPAGHVHGQGGHQLARRQLE
jgi:hypothetical protein